MKTYKDLTLEGWTDGLSGGHFGGYIKEDLARDIEKGFKQFDKLETDYSTGNHYGKKIKCGDFFIIPEITIEGEKGGEGYKEEIRNVSITLQDKKGKDVTKLLDDSDDVYDPIGRNKGNRNMKWHNLQGTLPGWLAGDPVDIHGASENLNGKLTSIDKKLVKSIEQWCKQNSGK